MQEGAAQQQALMTPQPETTVVEDEFELAGLPGLPARNLEGMGATTMADGGIVAFDNGGTTRLSGESFQDYRRRMFDLELQTQRDRNAAEVTARETERQRLLARQPDGVIPPSPFFDRNPLPASPAMQAAGIKTNAAPVAAQNPAAAAVQGGGTGQRMGLQDPRLQASTVSAMVKALEKPAVATKEKGVDRGTNAGAGAAPSPGGFAGLSALVSQREKQFRDEEQQAVNEEVAGLGKERTALEAAKEEAKKYGAEQEEKYKKRGERLDKDEKQNPYMTLIDTGLAMAAGKSPDWVQNLAAGAQQGLKGYQGRLDKVNEGRDGLEEAMFRLQNIRSDKVSAAGDKLRELNRAETKVKSDGIRALSKISEGAFNKQVDLKSKDIELAFKRWETLTRVSAANKPSLEERLVEELGGGVKGYEAFRKRFPSGKPADLMAEFNDFLKASPMLATGPQEQAIAAFMRSKLALSGLGPAPSASSTAAGPVRD
jgi:hypothetical protein